MYEHHIEMADAEPLETVLNGAAHAVGRVVEYDVVGRRRKGEIRPSVVLLGSLEQLTDLRREDVFVPILVVQVVPEASFGESEPVPGRHVVVAHAGAPGRIQGLIPILVGDDFELVAQRYTAQTELDGWYVVPGPLSGSALLAALRRCRTRPAWDQTAGREGGARCSHAEKIAPRCHV